MDRNTAKSRFTVLIDTNILVSGLVFRKGNEHKILKLAEDGMITLVLPEFVLEEAREVFARRFPGHASLLEAFLSQVERSTVPRERIEEWITQYQGAVRDAKDAAVLTSTVLSKPRFAITGDKTLRDDMRRCEAARGTTTCSSSEFLKAFRKQSLKRKAP